MKRYYSKTLDRFCKNYTSAMPLLVGLVFVLWGTGVSAQTYTAGSGLATNGATITTCSGNYVDSGGTGGGYGLNQDITVTFCSSTGQPITLSFDNFNIGVGDFLYVYDGPSTASPQFAGSPHSSGGFAAGPKVKTSTGTCITVRFTSNGSPSVNDVGWNANIFCATASTITACSGNFFDPGGSAANTPHLNSTITTICSDNGGQPRVTFSSFALDANFDFLYVYNGPNRNSPQVAGSPFSASSPGVITGTGTCLTFHFISDGSFDAAGWASTISCVGGCTPATVTAMPTCNGTTYNVSGTVTTTANSGTLTISDGAASTVINLPQTSPIPYTLTGLTPGTGTHTVTATFSASSACNGSTTYSAPASCGPSADYVLNSASNGTTVNTCTGKFADSGNLAGSYGNNENNTITFCSNNNKQLTATFNNFATQAGSDLLYIYNGPNTSSPQVPGSPFSGVGSAASPGVVSGSGTCLTFRFVSNGSTTNFGWDADISCSGNIPVAPTAPTWTGYPYTTCTPNTKIEGTVFEDFDNDGIKDAREPFVRGVQVRLYDNAGQVGSAATTDANGLYSFTSLTAAAVYRVEFTIPTGFSEGAVGTGSGSAVQFVRAGTCNANLGLFDAGHYCGLANPKWTIPMYSNGSPSHSSNTGAIGVARFNYNSSGQSPNADQENWVTFGTIGTTWGTAYRRDEQALYMASVLRRHTGLGPGGIGAIYKRLDSGNNTTAPVFYDFGAAAGTVANNATRFPGTGNAFGAVGACGLCDNLDPTVFGQVGKTGLGDIDFSGDEKTMYVTNLFDRKVYTINMDNPTAGSATALPNQPWLSASTCNNGTARPWALKYRRGKLYVGVVCDAGTSTCSKTAACNDLTATVYEYNGSTWSTVITYPLNYYRKAYALGSNYWVKWMDNWSDFTANYANVTDAQFAQPVLVDIEFDDDGSMIMGFGDRTAMQTGYQAPPPPGPTSSTAERTFAHGDMLRAYFNPSTQTFSLENNGVAGPLTSTNPASNVGPGGKAFYWGDFWYGAYNDANIGSLGILPGSGEVMHPIADPIDPYASGIIWTSNINGKANRKLEAYQGSPTGNAPNFAKNGGLGDIELFCANPPIEIGNYVWWDHNLNGRMDPSEPGIPNVTLRLYLDIDGNTTGNNPSNGDEVLVATTTTDAFGRYIFSYSGAPANGLNAQTWQAGHTRVLASRKYQVRINNFASDAGLTAYATSISSPSFIMTPTQNQGIAGTERDNNGYNNPGNAAAAITTGLAGQHNHQFDFAFGPGGGCSVTAIPTANTPCLGETLNLNANASGGTAPYTYSWAGPNSFTSTSATPSIPNVTLAADGTYTVTVTDAGSCVAVFSIVVQINRVTVSATTSPASCGMSTGSINLTVSNGITPYTFDWANNALDGTEDPTNLAAGNYPVTVTDANGCSATAAPAVGSSGGPSVSGAIVQPTCGLSNGSINLTITNGTAPYTYDWNVNALDGTEDPTGLAAGTYSVTITDAASCVAGATFELISSAGPTASITSVNTTCGLSNGSINLTVTGGTPAYTYDWNVNALDGTEDPSALAAGTYTVTVSDVNTCTATASAIIAPSTGFTASTTQVNETCSTANGTISLTVTGGASPFTYDWSNIPGTDNGQNQTGLAAGTYTVTVTDANNCTATTAATITNTAGPTTLNVTTTDATSCNGSNGTVDLQVFGGAIPYVYDWNNDGNPPPDYDPEDLTGLAPGTYIVTVTDNNGCTATTSATIGIGTGATVTPTIVDPTTCAETGSITLAVSGGVTPYTFDWNNIPGPSNPQNQSGLAGGTYIVTVTEGNGCTVATSMSIRDIREPVLNVTVTAPTCGSSNGAIDLTIIPGDGTGPFTIDWSNVAGSPNPEDQTGLPTGIYTVTVTDNISCSSTLVVSLSSDLAPAISLVTTNVTCSANNGAIDLTITGGATPYNIDWDNLAGASNPEDQTGLAAGTYAVTVTDNNGCTAIDVATIVNAAAVSAVCTPTDESTAGGNDGSIALTVGELGPFTFDWNDNTLDGLQNPTNLAPGTYTVTVIDLNNCSTPCVATVQARMSCTQTITSPTPATQTLCSGSAGANTSVTTSETGNIRFVRFTSDQIANNAAPTLAELDAIYTGGTVLATVTPTGAGPYTATLTAGTAGWSSLAAGTYYVYAILNPDQGAVCRPVQEIVVTIASAPALTTTNAATCVGNPVSLASLVTGNTPAGTLSYHTSQADATAGTNALINEVVNPLVSTTYYVRSAITGGASICFDTEPIVVTVNTPPTLTVTNGSVCSGNSINLATLVTSSGGGSLSYHTTLSDAENDVNALVVNSVSPASATNYYVRSEINGCYTVREVVVSISASSCATPSVNGPN